MRKRNLYGLAGAPIHRSAHRPEPGPRRAVTKRGQIVLERSRRRLADR
jgi:hypothetical protein